MTAVRRSFLFAGVLLLLSGMPSLAASPFDMSPERDGAPPTEQPASTAAPEGGPAVPTEGPGTTPAGAPATPPRDAYASASTIGRYIVPGGHLRFEGEMGERSWGITLTAEQAAHAATLTVATNSSIYVAPEDSRLRVSVNERQVVDVPLAAHENATAVSATLAPDTFKPGLNIVTFSVVQRHRTDCTIQSTYDLWTDVDGSGTGIIYDIANPQGFIALDDLAAVGGDAAGVTNIRLVLPPRDGAVPDEGIIRLVQAVSLRGNFHHPVVEVASSLLDSPTPGTLQLAAGTIAELAPLVGQLDPARASQVGFVDSPGGTPLLVVAGADRRLLTEAIDYAVRSDQALSVAPPVVDTTSWRLPVVPVLTGSRELSFADLGVKTQEFSGRRFPADFRVALPDDFYAAAYGEAKILLDAGYAEDVKRGSHFDVYTNGYLVANVPLAASSGDIFRRLPIKVPLTHFKPGVNSITLEAVLYTDADAACAPGAPGGGSDHFALFDTSTFKMPDFGRIGRWPNLAAFAGTGSPYGGSGKPVQLVFGRSSPEAYGASATILAKLAQAAGRIVPVVIGQGDATTDGPAILIGALNEFSAPTLATFRIAEKARGTWTDQTTVQLSDVSVNLGDASLTPDAFGDEQSTSDVYNRWQRDVVNPGGLKGTWLSFERWLGRTRSSNRRRDRPCSSARRRPRPAAPGRSSPRRPTPASPRGRRPSFRTSSGRRSTGASRSSPPPPA